MTKKKIAWITDSTAYITEELKNHEDVFVMPLEVIFGNDAFEDGVDLTTEELYTKIRNQKEIPKTSQPASGKFEAMFEKLKENYDGGIAIHVSSKLSGTLSSCKAGAEMAGFPLETVDSKSMSYSITTLLNKGIQLSKNEQSIKQLASELRQEADKSKNYILLGNLEQFYKGGRMSGTQFLLGSILKIKPIIRVNPNGEFELFEKVRSEKKAVCRLIELFKEDYESYCIEEIQIMHGNVLEKAKSLESELKVAFPGLRVVIGEISSTIAVHAGEGTVAIIWHREQAK